MIRIRDLRSILIALTMLSLLNVAACTESWVIVNPQLPPRLPPEVDSVVLRPAKMAARLRMNEGDLALFDKYLRAAFAGKQRLRTFDQPPTTLPNTVLVAGYLRDYGVKEQRGEGLMLRTIELDAEVTVMPVEGEERITQLRRRLAYQRIYPDAAPAGALPLDLENAMRELADLLAEAVEPTAQPDSILLEAGRDPISGERLGHPALVKGNRFAVAKSYARAKQAWHSVLFDPSNRELERTYRITERTLNQLRFLGTDEAVLDKLRPLAAEPEMTLVQFRARLRQQLGGVVENEGVVLTLADRMAAYSHLNLAAAHVNLAHLYRLEKRHDLSTFHLARAYAHNPREVVLSEWGRIQKERNLTPTGLSDTDALDLYLRIPPPSTASIRPGRFDLTVLPAPAFAEADEAAGDAGTSPAAQLRPVALPPTPVTAPPAN